MQYIPLTCYLLKLSVSQSVGPTYMWIVNIMRPHYRVDPAIYGNADKARVCAICCGKNVRMNIRHVHFSTQWSNNQVALAGNDSLFCPNCDLEHNIEKTGVRAILTSSTLGGVPLIGSWVGVPFHCDWESVAGGTIPVLRR